MLGRWKAAQAEPLDVRQGRFDAAVQFHRFGMIARQADLPDELLRFDQRFCKLCQPTRPLRGGRLARYTHA